MAVLPESISIESKCPQSNWGAQLRRLMRIRPDDVMLAASVSAARIPVVGRHLRPLGAITAAGIWGYRHLPDFLGSAVGARKSGNGGAHSHRGALASEVAGAALSGILPAADLAVEWPAPQRVAPVWKALEHRKNLYRSAVRYGDHPSLLLDVWRRKDLSGGSAPVLLFVPGGAWVHGSRSLQGYAMLSHLADQGWVCLSIDYRVAPHDRWPQHIHDVKSAIAWARANVDRFGGNRDFIAVAGCSAGGHLAALAGLTIDDPDYQAHLPAGSDTSVDAVVGIYGRYDWEDRSTAERDRFVDFLERIVVSERQSRKPELFRNASPMARVHSDAPPFLVVHGSGDSVIPVQQARDFVHRLRAESGSLVGHLELPGAGPGFDLTDGARTGTAATAIGLFLNRIHRDHSLSTDQEVI